MFDAGTGANANLQGLAQLGLGETYLGVSGIMDVNPDAADKVCREG